MHTGEEGHARPGWTTSRLGQDSPWKSQSEWQRTEINGESTSIAWLTRGSRTQRTQQNIGPNARTRNFYRMTLFASAVYTTALCLCLCVSSRSSTKWLNIWLRTCKFRPVCDVHRFSFVDDFTFHYKRFTCKHNQIRRADHRHTKINIYMYFYLFYLPRYNVQYSQ